MEARHLHIDIRNNLRYFAGRLCDAPGRATGFALNYFFTSFTASIVLAGCGTAGLVLAFGAVRAGWPEGTLADIATGVLFSAGLACTATMIGSLRVLGEAERYIEYATPWLTILAALAAAAACCLRRL